MLNLNLMIFLSPTPSCPKIKKIILLHLKVNIGYWRMI